MIMDPRKEYSPVLKRLIDEEIGDIDPRFKKDIVDIISARGFNPAKAMQDLHLYYPFWLSRSFNGPGVGNAVNELTRFNLWFGFHALVQDDLLDERSLEVDRPKKILFSDYFLLKAFTHLDKLRQALDRKTAKDASAAGKIDIISRSNDLYDDYINCVLWEKRRPLEPSPYSEKDIRCLGKKYSMLKINNIILSHFANRNNLIKIDKLDAFLEDYHICMQIIDDIKDWKTDLENGNLSYILWCLQYEYRIPLKTENLEKLNMIITYSGIIKRAAEKALEHLHSALSDMESLNNPYLMELVMESKRFIESIIKVQEQDANALLNEVEMSLKGTCSQQ
jgi:hypothetical protein